jgi:hypothetical protein
MATLRRPPAARDRSKVAKSGGEFYFGHIIIDP